MSTAPPLVRACNPTDLSKPGHALVIAHYLDPTTNTRIFLMGEESSYVVQIPDTRMRRFPPSENTLAKRKAYALANRNLTAARHFVIRENKSKIPSNYKYTIQEANGTWGFPKGGGAEADSRNIAIREFEEETGYTLDFGRLVFKKCVEITRWDTNRGEDVTQQTVVFHYELADDLEKNTILSDYAAKHRAKEGELFNVNFFTEAEVAAKPKNRVSELAFSDFALDHATAIDQTVIPRGGEVLPAVAAPAPPPGPSSGLYVPPHLRPGAALVPALPPPAPKPSPGVYVAPHLRPGFSAAPPPAPTAAPTAAPGPGAWRPSGKKYAAPTSAPPPNTFRRKWGGTRKSRKRTTRKRRNNRNRKN